MMNNLPFSVILVSLLSGIILIFSDSFVLHYRKFKRKKALKGSNDIPSYTGIVFSYVENLLNTVFPKSKISARSLITVCSVIFGFVFVLMFPTISIFAILPAAFFAGVPLMIMRFRLEKIRNDGSKEGEELVSGLLNCYRTNHKNIFAAMEEFISLQTDRCIITRELIFQLLISIRNTRSEVFIRKATEKFSFALRTNWSRMLSICIYAAAVEGLDITESLEDILSRLSVARTLGEEKKRSNTESVKMVQWFVPISYFGSLLLGTTALGVSIITMMKNQFTEGAGLMLFFIIIGLFITNKLLLGLILNSKLDY